MSQTPSQTQTPTQKDFFAPIYTREELERKLRKLNEKLRFVFERLELIRKLMEIPSYLYYELSVDIDVAEGVGRRISHVADEIYDIIDTIIVRELSLDTDIEKYEERYNVKFRYESERQLGVALLKENETVKPIVIYTDYETISYSEGERYE